MQHFGGNDAHHRRALEKRQIRTVITSVVTEDDETFTTRITTRVPLISIPVRPPATTADETTARETSTSTTPRPRPSSSDPTTRPTASSSSVSSSVVPSSSSSSLATSRPVAPSSSSEVTSDSEKTTTVFVPTAPSPSVSNVPGSSNANVGATSTGQTVGIVVGVVAGVIGVAIFAAFIVRHMRKRARDKESWDAAKFRRSALMLNEEKSNGGSGGRGPRPPSMIERRENANTASMVGAPTRAYPFTDGFQPQDLGYSRAGTPQQPQQYGAPNPYGAAPIPYTGQNMYGQGADRGYGNAAAGMGAGFGAGAAYGARTGTPHQGDMMDMHHPGYPVRANGHNSLPPFASYALPPINTGAPSTMARTNTTASNLPNPFSERAAAPAQTPPSPRDSGSSGHGTPAPSNQPRYMTRNGDEDEQDQRDAPPAYIDDGSYAKMQRDVKNPVVMSVEGTTTPSTAPASAATPTPAPAIATTMGNNRARPMSAHTVYDPSDAYGGM